MGDPVQSSYWWSTSSSGDGSASSYTRTDLSTICAILASIGASEGVADYANKYAATVESETVIIDTGAGLVDGKPHVCTTAGSVAVPAASGGGNTRIDRIVLRADWNAGGASPQTVRIVRIPGTSAAAPSVPDLTKISGTTYDIPLWQATVNTSGTVTVLDERPLRRDSLVAMGDDTAYSVMPHKSMGILIVNRRTVTSDYSAVLCYRLGATPFMQLISASNTVVVAATGDLAGTSGTDGKFTVSAASTARIYFENRLGGTRSVGWEFLGN